MSLPRSLPLAGAALLFASGAVAQSHPSPLVDPAATIAGGRPIAGPLYETSVFSRAVLRGTRTRTGRPGASYWVQHARYDIDATLDVTAARLHGHERVVYTNHSPDTLREIAVYLRQNVFSAGSPRRESVPVTGGVALALVAAAGRTLTAVPESARGTRPGYFVDGTVMWVSLPAPLAPADSIALEFRWSFTPPPVPSDGREGHDGNVYFIGYWYPEIAVYDDVDGWVADPYLNGAEFYMDPVDYDVRITVPRRWAVGATGSLVDSAAVLSPRTRERLALARKGGAVVHVISPEDWGTDAPFAGTGPLATWHYVARDVRDFAWGTSDHYMWDATIALVPRAPGGVPDTVAINSYFRTTSRAAAWRLGGARFTRDAIQQMSAYLWPYPYPQMSSFEGVLQSGGMEYPMATVMQPWADTLSLAGDLMHETGHMWFPMQVGSNETRYPWMDEGFTQFDVAQAMRVLYGEPRVGGRPNDSEQGQRRLYLATVRAGQDQPLMQLGDLSPTDTYFNIYYDKTAQVLAGLRAIIGAETLQRALREYGARWRDRHPQPADFFNTVDDVAGQDLSWFWQAWFYHAWALDQAIGSVREEGDSVAITIEDRGVAPMPVFLAVTRTGGAVERVTVPVDVWLSGKRTQVVRVAKGVGVVRAEIDPEARLPDFDRANQIWIAGPGH